MLPADPGESSASGNRNVPHSKSVISFTNRPYHQLPEKKIGYSPLMKPTPASSAFRPLESVEM